MLFLTVIMSESADIGYLRNIQEFAILSMVNNMIVDNLLTVTHVDMSGK